ncbi:MAG: hypothetical protein JXR65_03110 [Bacteroidales bacterium]|nr:hypothetical protein [Bacteroidales bacterium]
MIEFIRHEQYPEWVLVRKFSGKVEVKDIIDSWQYLLSLNILDDKVKGVINDLSHCDLNMDMDGFQQLMKYLKSKSVFNAFKLAVVCDDPKTIIFPVMGGVQGDGLKIRPFTTMDAAVEWLII